MYCLIPTYLYFDKNIFCVLVAGCQNNPCQNGGTCINRIGGFTCYCNEGYSDDICSTGKKNK